MEVITKAGAEEALKSYASQLYGKGDWKMGETIDDAISIISELPSNDMVPKAAYEALEMKYKTLLWLLQGEWVDCDAVQSAMNITFREGLKRFDFGRVARWNKPPLNGQFISTKFRLCEKSIQEPREFWNMDDKFEYDDVNRDADPSYHFDDFEIQECSVHPESNPNSHQIELIIEPQGGIL